MYRTQSKTFYNKKILNFGPNSSLDINFTSLDIKFIKQKTTGLSNKS